MAKSADRKVKITISVDPLVIALVESIRSKLYEMYGRQLTKTEVYEMAVKRLANEVENEYKKWEERTKQKSLLDRLIDYYIVTSRPPRRRVMF